MPPSTSVLLHSRYDPVREAVRWADAQHFSFIPAFIVISEPGESFLSPVLRERYPNARLIALRYHETNFSEFDSLWDAVWRPGTNFDITDFVFSLIPDEYLPLAVFLSWKPADAIWPEVSEHVWKGIASVLKLQTSIMQTRNHFGPRWLKNMIKNTALMNTVILSRKTSKPVFLASAGPTLSTHFPFQRDKFCVLAVSSALSCLCANLIDPDICLATDGGYWALDLFRSIKSSIPVGLPLEAALPSTVLEANPLMILSYGSETEKALLSIAGIEATRAFRNGSVSGTAAQFALSHTDKAVYAAGLDLNTGTAFTHARPHVLDTFLDIETSRYQPLSYLLYIRGQSNGSLDMYAAWFSSRASSFKNRFFRLLPAQKKIPGIECAHLSDVRTDISYPDEPVKLQSIPEKNVRRALLCTWLNDVCRQLIDDTKQSSAFSNPLLLEIMQLVSYTDYIHVLKKSSSPEYLGTVSDLKSKLCGKTAAFLEKMKVMVKQYG